MPSDPFPFSTFVNMGCHNRGLWGFFQIKNKVFTWIYTGLAPHQWNIFFMYLYTYIFWHSVITTSLLLLPVLLFQLIFKGIHRINFILFSFSLHPKHKKCTKKCTPGPDFSPHLNLQVLFSTFCHCCTAIYGSNKQQSSYSTSR